MSSYKCLLCGKISEDADKCLEQQNIDHTDEQLEEWECNNGPSRERVR